MLPWSLIWGHCSGKGLVPEENPSRMRWRRIKLPIHLVHSDHKTPLARGGGNTPGIFQLLCASCNGIKAGDFTDGEFRR